jgi:protein-tyrosine phosphatase
MAEGIMRARVNALESAPEKWRIRSGGINTQDGLPPSRFSEEVMAERGIDISNHHSSPINTGNLGQAALVLTMEKFQKSILRSRFPGLSNRIFMLSEMSGQEFPVDDPFGATLEDYRRTADVIERLIDAGMTRITELSILEFE